MERNAVADPDEYRKILWEGVDKVKAGLFPTWMCWFEQANPSFKDTEGALIEGRLLKYRIYTWLSRQSGPSTLRAWVEQKGVCYSKHT